MLLEAMRFAQSLLVDEGSERINDICEALSLALPGTKWEYTGEKTTSFLGFTTHYSFRVVEGEFPEEAINRIIKVLNNEGRRFYAPEIEKDTVNGVETIRVLVPHTEIMSFRQALTNTDIIQEEETATKRPRTDPSPTDSMF